MQTNCKCNLGCFAQWKNFFYSLRATTDRDRFSERIGFGKPISGQETQRAPTRTTPKKKRIAPNLLGEAMRFKVDDIGLENTAISKGKQHIGKKLTPNPTPSAIEQRLLELYRALPQQERRRLIEKLEAMENANDKYKAVED